MAMLQLQYPWLALHDDAQGSYLSRCFVFLAAGISFRYRTGQLGHDHVEVGQWGISIHWGLSNVGIGDGR